jgi:hypothetical protein
MRTFESDFFNDHPLKEESRTHLIQGVIKKLLESYL